MPTYEYACRDCGHRFDTVQSIHDDALTECPECGGSVRRVVAAVGVQFKGSGFYRTDSRESAGKAGKSGGSTSSSGSSESSGGDSGKTGDSASSKKATEGGSSGESKTSKDSTAPAKPSSTPTAGS